MKLEDIALEYRGAALGDKRRNVRLERIAMEIARNPGLGFPEAMRTEGQLEGLYRFLSNDQVTFEAVHAPHAQQTRSRCQAQERVLVLHDTTILRFNGERDGLGRIHDAGGARGFFVHTSLAVTPARTPLGVLRAETWARTRPPRRDRNQRRVRADPQRESLRWGRAVRECEELLGRPTGAIHVMDREGDNYDLFSELEAARACYVIRLANNRKLVGEREKLKQVVGRAECLFRREVWVNPRAAGRPHDRSHSPPCPRGDPRCFCDAGRALSLEQLRPRLPAELEGQHRHGDRERLPQRGRADCVVPRDQRGNCNGGARCCSGPPLPPNVRGPRTLQYLQDPLS